MVKGRGKRKKNSKITNELMLRKEIEMKENILNAITMTHKHTQTHSTSIYFLKNINQKLLRLWFP